MSNIRITADEPIMRCLPRNRQGAVDNHNRHQGLPSVQWIRLDTHKMTNRPPQTHRLKCEAAYFDATKWGEKLFEVRVNDRDYRVGDDLELVRTTCGMADPDAEELRVRVTYVLEGFRGLRKGWVGLGIERVA